MASSLFLLLDDIATVLDDVSTMTQVAAKKTAGVLGDDLALNAEQVSGVRASRELPVVWAVAKGSARNKLIVVPAALVISALIPSLVTVLLMLGGAYLCFEGVEKLLHSSLHRKDKEKSEQQIREALRQPEVDFKVLEQEKIRGAIRTDFILSAEIIVISLGAVADADLSVRVGALCAIAVIMTVGVYGLVAAIVRLDDLGLAMVKREGDFSQSMGRAILNFAPILMRFLSVAGTAAMFLVGGGIIIHGLPALEHLSEEIAATVGQPWSSLLTMLWTAVVGVAVGSLLVALLFLAKPLAERLHSN